MVRYTCVTLVKLVPNSERGRGFQSEKVATEDDLAYLLLPSNEDTDKEGKRAGQGQLKTRQVAMGFGIRDTKDGQHSTAQVLVKRGGAPLSWNLAFSCGPG